MARAKKTDNIDKVTGEVWDAMVDHLQKTDDGHSHDGIDSRVVAISSNLVSHSIGGNTSGTLALISSGILLLAGGNNITLSQAANTITLSAASQTIQTQNRFNLTLSGNTSGILAEISSGTLTLAGGNNITLSQAGNIITISGPTTVAQSVESQSIGMSNIGNTVGTTGMASGGQVQFVFAGGNNITLSQSLNGASGTISISAFNQTAPVVSNAIQSVGSATNSGTNTSRFAADDHAHAGVPVAGISGGNTLGDTGSRYGSVLFAGGNNITLSGATAAGGQTITISAFNQSVQAIGTQTLGMSNLGNTSGTTGTATGTGVQFLFAGGNNITLSQSINGASGTITISAANETQTVPPIGTAVKEVASAGSTGTITRFAPEDHAHRGLNLIQITGNTSNTSNIVYGSVYLAGGNNITLSQVSGAGVATITISAGAGGGAVVSNAIQEVASATNSGTNTSRFAADDHAHRGINLVQISGNTSNTSNVIYGSVYLAGGNNITLSQVSGAGAATITISAANAGAGAARSFFQWPDDVANSSAWQVSGSTRWLEPVYIPYDISVSYIRMPVTMSCVGSMASVATAANATRGMTLSSTFHYGFYTHNVGASSKSLISYATSSGSWVQQARVSAGAVGSNWTTGHTISFPREGGNTDFTSSAAATVTNITMQSSQLSDFTNLRFLDLPFATSLSAGPYWFMWNSSTSISTSGTANYSTLRILASNFVITQPSQAINMLGSATNSSNQFRQGLGSWTTNAIGTTASIALSGISTSASNPIVHFQMIRQA